MNNRLLGVEEILVAVLCNPFILRMGKLEISLLEIQGLWALGGFAELCANLEFLAP